MTQKQKNEYDETKKLLNRIRKLNSSTKEEIQEQITSSKPNIDVLHQDEDEPKLNQPQDDNWETPENQDQDDNWEAPENQTRNDNWDTPETETQDDSSTSENKDYTIVNNVEVVINSTDSADLQLMDDEKGKISQMIDDFRSEVSELTEFGKLNIYDDNAKLDGNLTEIDLNFTLSAGDDNGLFLSNMSMIKMNDNTLETINKLNTFQLKFNDILSEIISNRHQN